MERAFVALLAARDRQTAALNAFDRAAGAGTASTVSDSVLAKLRASADRLLDEVTDQAAALLLAPVAQLADLRLKLAVLIAASEPHPADAHALPALYLRALLADPHADRTHRTGRT